METPTPKRAAIYCRISDDRISAGGTKGLGIARQRQDCLDLCERRGWNVAEIIDSDNDQSAYSGKPRPGYKRLVDGLRDGLFDGVVAYAPDRLHRSPRELEDFVDVLDAVGAQVATVAGGDWDLTTAEGRFTARLLGNVARMESEKKSDRVARKQRELADRGRPSGGGRRPFGFEADAITHRPDEVAAIHDAATRVLAGESIGSIVRGWNEAGTPATVTGASWSKQALKQMITSPRIRGLRAHRGVVVGRAAWEPILDDETADAVEAVIARRGRGATRRNTRSFLLSGLIVCGRCGKALSGSTVKRKGKTLRRYSCKSDRGGCGKVGIKAESVDEVIVDAVHAAIDTTTLASAAPTADNAHVIAELDAIEARLELLDQRWTSGEIDDERHAKMTRTLIGKRDEARLAAEEATATIALPAPGDLLARWDDLDVEARHHLLATLIETITIAPATVGGGRFDPSRIDLRWRV